MWPFQFRDEAMQSARGMAEKFVEVYFPDNEYDGDAFLVRSQISVSEFVELTREDLEKPSKELSKKGGIYCIINPNGETVYVGLADYFPRRFTAGVKAHNDQCTDDCKHWGHFANPSKGAREVGMPNQNCRYFILEETDHKGFAIKQAEVDWYFIFRANGWEPHTSNNPRKITSREHALGLKGGDSKPIITLRLKDATYYYFRSSIEAQEKFPILVDSIRQVLMRAKDITKGQNQHRGFTHRYASKEEITKMEVSGERCVKWFDSDFKEIKDSSLIDRNSKMQWLGGRLLESEIQHTLHVGRGGDKAYGETLSSPYKGVSEHTGRKRGQWQCRAKKGPRGLDLWQVGPRKEWKSDTDAALARELKILEEGWQEFNKGDKGSNAILLNERLGTSFVDWEDS